ncbi:hypothetical protein D6855_05025 [Butyrivibrio sp. CB08]|uniref:hypothetical protein n=1 Tax=Butyrivibrio sp. CB08 TaxID=2364879 RepID=UPI000EA9CE88|nr:hypothetical protein [Butyrivibrio sp. CB08]RKM61256.1 hypothetical protein D6855_05025 [Butyrivibrio sp. CB08]
MKIEKNLSNQAVMDSYAIRWGDSYPVGWHFSAAEGFLHGVLAGFGRKSRFLKKGYHFELHEMHSPSLNTWWNIGKNAAASIKRIAFINILLEKWSPFLKKAVFDPKSKNRSNF